MSLRQVSRLVMRAALFAALSQGLAAQTAWVPVDPGPKVHADLRCSLVQVGNGYQVSFKNFGSKTLHFGYYLAGHQTANSVSDNHRIHLLAGNQIGPLTLVPEAGAQGAIKLHVVEVIEGNLDASAQ